MGGKKAISGRALRGLLLAALLAGLAGGALLGAAGLVHAAGDPPFLGLAGNGLAAAAATPQPTAFAPSTFRGVIVSMPETADRSGAWNVNGRTVYVTPTTTVDESAAPAVPGALVQVEGVERADASLNASKITVLPEAAAVAGSGATATPQPTATAAPAGVGQSGGAAGPDLSSRSGSCVAEDGECEDADQASGQAAAEDRNEQDRSGQSEDRPGQGRPVEFRGAVSQMPGHGLVGVWHIGGRTVYVAGDTRVQQKQGALRDGAYVQVQGWLQADGSLRAHYIMTKKANPGQGHQGDVPAGRGWGNNGKHAGKAGKEADD